MRRLEYAATFVRRLHRLKPGQSSPLYVGLSGRLDNRIMRRNPGRRRVIGQAPYDSGRTKRWRGNLVHIASQLFSCVTERLLRSAFCPFD